MYANVTNLICDEMYDVFIMAKNSKGYSSRTPTFTFSIESSFNATCPTIESVNAPGPYIGVTDINTSAVRVSFLDNSDNEDGFIIYTDEGLKFLVPKNDEMKKRYQYANLTGLTCDKTYKIEVVAYKNDVNSTPSELRNFNIFRTFDIPCKEEIKNRSIIKIGQTVMLRDSTSSYGGLYWSITPYEGRNWKTIESIDDPDYLIRNPPTKTILYTPTTIGDKVLSACGVKYFEDDDTSCSHNFLRVINPNYTYIDELVIDNITGLMWQDNDTRNMKKGYTISGNPTDTSGDTATTYCNDLLLNGYNDWRLPNTTEASSYTRIGGEHWVKNDWVSGYYGRYATSYFRFEYDKYSFLNSTENLLVKCVRDVD